LCAAEPPQTAPILPREITDLWVAAECQDEQVAWHSSGGRAWTTHRQKRMIP